jgi:large-conductance mechanosensitive channel
MTDTLLKILPLSLSAAISPTSFVLLIVIMSRNKNPVKGGLEFILGGICSLAVIGAAVILTIKGADIFSRYDGRYLFPAIDFILGATAIILLIKYAFQKPSQKKEKKPSTGSFTECFMAGFWMRLISSNTIPPFIGAVKAISVTKLSTGNIVLLHILNLTLALLPLIAPVALFMISPGLAFRIFMPVKNYLEKHERAILCIILAWLAWYFISAGISGIRA